MLLPSLDGESGLWEERGICSLCLGPLQLGPWSKPGEVHEEPGARCSMEVTCRDPEPGKVHVDPGLDVLVTQVTCHDPKLLSSSQAPPA